MRTNDLLVAVGCRPTQKCNIIWAYETSGVGGLKKTYVCNSGPHKIQGANMLCAKGRRITAFSMVSEVHKD